MDLIVNIGIGVIVGSVESVIETDEVFFAESFKGTKPSKMPIKSRKRGKEVKKRGKHFKCLQTFSTEKERQPIYV